jgi:hypothetical protein
MMEAHGGGGLFTSWQPESKERRREGSKIPKSLQEHTLTDLTSSQNDLPPKKGPTTTSQQHHMLGTKPSTHVENISDPVFNTGQSLRTRIFF